MQDLFLNIPDNFLIIFIIIIFLIINIIPVMIFVTPELFIMWIVYMVVIWKISIFTAIIAMVLWSIIWEIISYILWYKWKKILFKINFITKNKQKIQIFEKKLRENPIRYLIIWKLLPFTTWFVPIVAWYLKIDFKKFFIINSIMVFWWIFSIFFIMYTGNNLLDIYLKAYKKELIITLFIIFIFIFLYKIFSSYNKKDI